MQKHLWTLIFCALIGSIGLSNEAHAWNKKGCAPEPCASPQCATSQTASPPAEKCPPKKSCHFQIFPSHKSCLNFPEHVKPPCIVPPCPAPPPPCLPANLCLTMPSPKPAAPTAQAPTK